jgi:hypothetical protein
MNRSAVLVALALCLPLTARADDASHRAKAQQMIDVVHTERMVEGVSDNIKKQVSAAAERMIGPNPTPESKARLIDFDKKMDNMVDQQMGWKVMEPAFIDFYTNAFTEEQLDAIVAFYKTPAGIALAENMPKINTQVTQLGQSKMVVLQPELKQLFEDFQKSSAPPAATPAPAANPAPPTGPQK